MELKILPDMVNSLYLSIKCQFTLGVSMAWRHNNRHLASLSWGPVQERADVSLRLAWLIPEVSENRMQPRQKRILIKVKLQHKIYIIHVSYITAFWVRCYYFKGLFLKISKNKFLSRIIGSKKQNTKLQKVSFLENKDAVRFVDGTKLSTINKQLNVPSV